MDEEDLLAIKRLIVKYLAEKVTKKADEIWDKKNWTDEDMERMLLSEERTPYNPNN